MFYILVDVWMDAWMDGWMDRYVFLDDKWEIKIQNKLSIYDGDLLIPMLFRWEICLRIAVVAI